MVNDNGAHHHTDLRIGDRAGLPPGVVLRRRRPGDDGDDDDQQQADLIERLRALLANEPSSARSMFGGRSSMVNDAMVASALKDGDLLVRVQAERHAELSTDERPSFWLEVALERNRLAR